MTFTLPQTFSEIQLTGAANVDDYGRVFLNGHPLTPSLTSGDPGIVSRYGNATFRTTNAAWFVPGTNAFLVSDDNTGGPSGGGFYATISFQAGSPPACVPPPAGLVSWWPADGNALDIVSGNNGTLEGGVTFTNGEVGQAFSFDGTGYVEVGDKADLVMSNSFSFEGWIYPTGPGTDGQGGGIIINKENEYEIARFPDGTIQWAFANWSPGWEFIDSGAITLLNEWSHVAVVYSNGMVNTYPNGILANTYLGSGSIGQFHEYGHNDFDFRIGGCSAGNEFFQGLIDEVPIYNRALTSNEVAAIYFAGAGGKCPSGFRQTFLHNLRINWHCLEELPNLASPPVAHLRCSTNGCSTARFLRTMPKLRVHKAMSSSLPTSQWPNRALTRSS